MVYFNIGWVGFYMFDEVVAVIEFFNVKVFLLIV